MNRLWRATTHHQKAWMKYKTNNILSTQGAQRTMYNDLVAQEQERATLFSRELAEVETADVLDRALLRAHNAKLNGDLPAPEYHRIADKVKSLKTLRFVEEYEQHQDKETYEWIKYKVAAEIGGEEEKEAFKLYEKIKIDELGETKFKLIRESNWQY